MIAQTMEAVDQSTDVAIPGTDGNVVGRVDEVIGQNSSTGQTQSVISPPMMVGQAASSGDGAANIGIEVLVRTREEGDALMKEVARVNAMAAPAANQWALMDAHTKAMLKNLLENKQM